MIGRWGLFKDVRRCLRECGIPEDVAGELAPKLVALVRERRDAMIAAAARQEPMTDAQLAELWGIDRTLVVKIRRKAAAVNDPAADSPPQTAA